MEEIVRIPKDHLVVVCDARKALLLRNIGPVARPEFEIIEHLEAEAQGPELLDADRPGRRADGGKDGKSGGPRSAMEVRDVGDLMAEYFANTLVHHLKLLHRKSPLAGLVTVAPPSFLGLLRSGLKDELRRIPTKEVAKHLTELPVRQLQQALLQNLS